MNKPISASHTLLQAPKFAWVNNVAENRVDCRRQAGLSDNINKSTVSSKAINASLLPKGVKFTITRHGIQDNQPGYSIPKDANSSFFKQNEKKGRGIARDGETVIYNPGP